MTPELLKFYQEHIPFFDQKMVIDPDDIVTTSERDTSWFWYAPLDDDKETMRGYSPTNYAVLPATVCMLATVDGYHDGTAEMRIWPIANFGRPGTATSLLKPHRGMYCADMFGSHWLQTTTPLDWAGMFEADGDALSLARFPFKRNARKYCTSAVRCRISSSDLAVDVWVARYLAGATLHPLPHKVLSHLTLED